MEALPIDVRLGRKPTLDMLYGVVDIAAVVVDVLTLALLLVIMLVWDGTPPFWEEVKLQNIYSGIVVFSTTASRRYGKISM